MLRGAAKYAVVDFTATAGGAGTGRQKSSHTRRPFHFR